MKNNISAIILLLFLYSQTTFSQEETSFNEYIVEMYRGELKDPDFTSNPKAVKYKTVIINACSEGINFAGKYTLAVNGCGTACQFGIVIDRATGIIYDGFTSELGYRFQENSQLLIKNEDILNYSDEMQNSEIWKVKHLIWVGDQFVEIK